MVAPLDLVAAKSTWLAALADAGAFIRRRPPAEIGCLYWSTVREAFVMPTYEDDEASTVRPHWVVPGGVVPQLHES